MSESSITLVLNQLRRATNDEERQAAAAALYRCYRGQVEQIARGRLATGGGLADEEDVAQSAFRSFFDRIESGQLDALVTGGQAWAILARLTRNKAIDSVRYDNAQCRGGEGARRPNGSADPNGSPSLGGAEINGIASAGSLASAEATRSARLNLIASASSSRMPGSSKSRPNGKGADHGRNRLMPVNGASASSRIEKEHRAGGRREDFPLDAVRDRTQRPCDEQVASDELVERFMQQLSEATLRGIVSLKMDGFTNEEIAERLGCATRTVERKLNLIRKLWVPILANTDVRELP